MSHCQACGKDIWAGVCFHNPRPKSKDEFFTVCMDCAKKHDLVIEKDIPGSWRFDSVGGVDNKIIKLIKTIEKYKVKRFTEEL